MKPPKIRFKMYLALACTLLLLAMAPLAGALEVHHEFAEADHDGHQHSDFDLCQWVQFNAGNSLTLEAIQLSKPWVETSSLGQFPVLTLFSAQFSRSTTPRGPPLS